MIGSIGEGFVQTEFQKFDGTYNSRKTCFRWDWHLMSQLIPESFLIQCVGDHDENNRSQMVSSSDEEGEENEMTENDDLKTVDGIPFLGLIDEENILTLPPEGYGEASDNEGSEDWIAIKDEGGLILHTA